MSIGPPRHDADWEQFTLLEGHTFGTTAEETATYIAAVRDHAIARFAVEDDRVVAGALAFPCTQQFGGREVPAGAVASVCVAHEHRGRGLGKSVMWSLVAGMRDHGLAVAPLWPSSVGFYRGMGWEIGGEVREYAVAAHLLPGGSASGQAVRDPDLADVHSLRTAVASGWSGPIVRPTWWWDWRRPEPAPDKTHRFGWVEGGQLTGVVTFQQKPPAGRYWGYDVWVTEFWTATADALTGLAGLLASEAPLSPTIRFLYGVLPGGSDLQWRVPDVGLDTTGTNSWMTRVLDPALALGSAGWPDDIEGTLEIEIAAIGQSPTRLNVDVSGGRATTTEGGTARVRMSAGAFAGWFTGAMPATTAARLRLAGGAERDLAFMDRLTAGRRPWLPDVY